MVMTWVLKAAKAGQLENNGHTLRAKETIALSGGRIWKQALNFPEPIFQSKGALSEVSGGAPVWISAWDSCGERSGVVEAKKWVDSRFPERYHCWVFVVEVEAKVMSDSLQPHGLYSPWNSPGQNTGVGSFSLLQGIFPTQGSSPGLPHCRWILYQLSHEGGPRILEWVAYSFSSRPSQPRSWTRVSCTAGRYFKSWASRDSQGLVVNRIKMGEGEQGAE